MNATGNQKQLYVYHWNRIFIALAVLLCLIATLIYASRAIFFREASASRASTEMSQAETRQVVTTESLAPDTHQQSESPAQLPAPAAPDPDPETGAQQSAVSTTSPSPISATMEAVAPATSEPAEPTFQLDDLPSATASKQQGDHALKLKFVEIVSPDVSRFVLSQGVKDLEPVGSLLDIQVSKDAPVRLFAYSDLKNRKDQHFKYIWKHRNKVVSTVSVGAWSDNWRSYSSKLVEQRLSGDWLVELRDSNNSLLAKAGFRFNP